MAQLQVKDDELKMLRETLCTAQWYVNNFANNGALHGTKIQKLIDEIDIHRPLGSDGKHGNLHTETCGCEDKERFLCQG